MPRRASKAVSNVVDAVKSVGEGAGEFVEKGVMDAPAEEVADEQPQGEEQNETVVESESSSKSMTMEERMAKMEELRKRMVCT